MSRQLPRFHTETFVIEFNDKGYRFSAKAKMTIDLHAARHTIGRRAARNGGSVSRDGDIVVELVSKPKSVGAELPEIGTVCHE